MSLKKNVSQHLSTIADMMEFLGENRFKINAFRNGANIIRRLEGDIEEMIKDGSLQETKGIGKGIYSVILEFSEKGSSTEYEKYKYQIPDGIFDLFKIKGLGAGKIRKLYTELEITNIKGLEKACSENKVAELKGFGKKTQEKIINEIERIKGTKGKVLLNEAMEIAGIISDGLKKIRSVLKVQTTGEIRRIRETISKVEFVVLLNSFKHFSKDLDNLFEFKMLSGNTSSAVFVSLGKFEPEIVIYAELTEENFAQKLFQTTGSEEFLEKLTLDKITGKEKSEEEIFRSLGINFIIPEMREKDFHRAPAKLTENSRLDIKNFKGFLHFHTVWSDGVETLTGMLNALEHIGYEYCAVCDHSKAAYYANGLNEERVLKQKEEIEKLRKDFGIKILHGIEVDILKNGDLDFSNDFMKIFDFVVASVHSIFNLPEDEMTNRIIKAIENEHTNLLAHPTGRLLLRREGYDLNIRKVIDACSANNVAIEINANPYRLDLDWRNLYYAREKNCKISINPDAHSIDDISYIHYGIKIARKGGVQPEEVINTFDLAEFIRFTNK